MNKQSGKSTTINRELEMLSVTYCVRSQNQESITHYFDKQVDDFMKLFFESLFKSTEQVSIDNQYNKVTVLGFNSKRFDVNMILHYMDKYKYHFVKNGLIGSSTQQNQVVISRNPNTKENMNTEI